MLCHINSFLGSYELRKNCKTESGHLKKKQFNNCKRKKILRQLFFQIVPLYITAEHPVNVIAILHRFHPK